MATLQTKAVLDTLSRLGHATNIALHSSLAERLPELSLTSLHRITARLVERGAIGTVPTDSRTVVLDTRADQHDHFVCTHCGGIVDITLPESAVASIQEQLGAHLAEGGLVIRGRCAQCRTTPSDVSEPSGP